MRLTVPLCLILAVAACNTPEPNLTREEAVTLLNSDQVTWIGVSHSGWTLLTLRDGTRRGNRAEVIGYPQELLDQCSDCSNVLLWIE